MATYVSICSNALIMLGAAPIASFTEATKSAQVASNLFPDLARDFLRGHPWNVAIKRVQLAPQATAPAFDWSASFLLPSDCLRVWEVKSGRYDVEHKVEGHTVLADVTGIDLVYISNLPVDQWDAVMVTAMTYRMAGAMAYAITKSATLADGWMAAAERKVREAKALDGQEGTPDDFGDNPLMNSRLPGGGF